MINIICPKFLGKNIAAACVFITLNRSAIVKKKRHGIDRRKLGRCPIEMRCRLPLSSVSDGIYSRTGFVG